MNSKEEMDDLEKFNFYLNAEFELVESILFSNIVHKPSMHEINNMIDSIGKNKIERLYNHFHMSAITDDSYKQREYSIAIWQKWRLYFSKHMPKKKIAIEIYDYEVEVILCVYELTNDSSHPFVGKEVR